MGLGSGTMHDRTLMYCKSGLGRRPGLPEEARAVAGQLKVTVTVHIRQVRFVSSFGRECISIAVHFACLYHSLISHFRAKTSGNWNVLRTEPRNEPNLLNMYNCRVVQLQGWTPFNGRGSKYTYGRAYFPRKSPETPTHSLLLPQLLLPQLLP